MLMLCEDRGILGFREMEGDRSFNLKSHGLDDIHYVEYLEATDLVNRFPDTIGKDTELLDWFIEIGVL